MVAKINILKSYANMVAKINIRVFKICEQLRLKFGKICEQPALTTFIGSNKKKSIPYAVKNYGKFFLTLFNSVYFCNFWHGSNEN